MLKEQNEDIRILKSLYRDLGEKVTRLQIDVGELRGMIKEAQKK